MTVYGVTSTGFNLKPYSQIRADLETKIRQKIGQSIPTTGNTKWGNLINIIASEIAEAWEVGEDTYSAFTPEGAIEQSLTSLSAITATVRKGATYSTVVATCTGTPGTTLLAGRVFSVTGTGARFATTEDVIIGGGGTVDVLCEAEDTGPIAANSGTLTTIETPVVGLSSVTNAEDADLGANEETDEELATRREEELRGQGKGAVPAIRTAVSRLDGVTAVSVFENYTLVTDGDGLPAKSFLVLVAGGDDDEILQAIFDNKPAGIQPYIPGGGVSGVITVNGVSYTMGFVRPTDINIWAIINVDVIAEDYPSDGDDQIEAAVLAWAASNLGGGDDVVAAAVGARAFGIPGVKDVEVLIGTVNPPVASTTITVGPTQQADLDSSRIVVNSTPVGP